MATFAVASSGAPLEPCGFALKKREQDFQGRKSCLENLCRDSGVSGQDGLRLGRAGQRAIAGSILVCNKATKGLVYYVSYATSLR